MVRPLAEAFGAVLASDVHDYGFGYPVRDYLFGPISDFDPTHWTITNPPFRLAEQFIERALELSKVGCAMLVRSAFLEGVGRFERLFGKRPPTTILQFSERVVMHKGRLAPEGSTATAYCWVVWEHECTDTNFDWIAPCRKRLERAADYAPRWSSPHDGERARIGTPPNSSGGDVPDQGFRAGLPDDAALVERQAGEARRAGDPAVRPAD
jgi:hypothetical protein